MFRRLVLASIPTTLLLGACLGPETAPEEAGVTENAIAAPIEAGDYVIHTRVNDHCLDVSGSSSADGAKVQEWTCNGTNAQLFHVTPVGDGYYKIINASSEKSLDVKDISPHDNALIQQWSYWGGANQHFAIVDRGAGRFSIHPRHTGMALDVFWGRTDDGTPIVQYPYWGRDNQLWTFERKGGGSAPESGGGPLPTRLRVRSMCADPVWIAHSDNMPGPQNVMLSKGQWFDYDIPDSGLNAVRVWPKIGCDGGGHNCRIGESVAPCPAGGCQPPVDSKFEASFAPRGSGAQTWYNLSQVDGYTLPFKVVPRGKGAEEGGCVTSDCGHLSLDACPGDEDMSGGGIFPAYGHQDLRVRDSMGHVVGCLSPCKKWNYPSPWGLGMPESADPGLHLCCPTPIDPATGQCHAANACMSPDACRDAADPVSVVHTKYVKAMQAMCPTAYSYSYDDAAGLHNCPSETGFEVTFCP